MDRECLKWSLILCHKQYFLDKIAEYSDFEYQKEFLDRYYKTINVMNDRMENHHLFIDTWINAYSLGLTILSFEDIGGFNSIIKAVCEEEQLEYSNAFDTIDDIVSEAYKGLIPSMKP